MEAHGKLRTEIEDISADLRFAWRVGDVGRVLLLCYFDVRRWARSSGNVILAQRASELFLNCPFETRDALVAQLQGVTAEVERLRAMASPEVEAQAAPAGIEAAASH